MRFYTAEMNGKQELLVAFAAENSAYRLSLLQRLDNRLNYEDMNDLVCSMGEAERSSLELMGQNRDTLRDAAVNLADIKLCAPIVHPRQDVICLGINYDAHAQEAGRFSAEAFGGERPYTIYFSKRVSQATGSGDVIPAYKGLVDSLDYEAELGVVLGKDVKNISAEEALQAVFGYLVINDVSARNLQTRHKQWYRGKSLDGFTPMGPCLVTADEIEDVQNLDIRCYVNNELRQSSNTRYMIQTVAGAIAELSEGMTLQAGTIIATGTPAGVGMGMQPPAFLQSGDQVICEIEKIGRLINTVK